MSISPKVKIYSRLLPLGIIFLISAVVIYLIRFDLEKYFYFSVKYSFLTSLVLAGYGAAIILMNYLRGNKSKNYESEYLSDELRVLRSELLHSAKSKDEIDNIYVQIQELKNQFASQDSSDSILTEEDKSKIRDSVKKSLTSDLSSTLMTELELKYSVDMKKDRQLKQIREQLDRARNRFRQEIDALGRRGNLNLVIGVLTTIVAVGILASTVINQEKEITQELIVTSFVPRATLSIFIEIFSFFFLKLYKSGLGEVKYFQNELTNVELKFVSLENAIISDNQESVHKVICDMSQTERNFRLEKGQSTVDIEKMKLEGNSTKKILAVVTDLFKATNK